MHWVINMSSFCFHRILNGRSPVKSVWSQQEVAFKTGSWTCSQFCIGSFVSHLTLLHLLYLIFSCLSAIGQEFLTNQVFTISEVLLEKTQKDLIGERSWGPYIYLKYLPTPLPLLWTLFNPHFISHEFYTLQNSQMAYFRNPMLKFLRHLEQDSSQELQMQPWCFLCQVEISAYIAVLCVSLPSPFVNVLCFS